MSDTRRMNPADVPDDLIATGYQAIYGDAWRHCDRDDRVVEKILAAVLPEFERQVREKVAEEISAWRCDQPQQICDSCQCRPDHIRVARGETS